MQLNSIKQLVQDVIDGNENPLEAYGIIKNQIDELIICLSKIKEDSILEALKEDRKTFSQGKYKFQLKEGGASYSYKNIPEWVKSKKELDTIQAKAKIAYSAYKGGLNTADNDGEVSILPIVTYSQPSLSVRISE